MNIVILPSWFRLKSNRTKGSFFLEQAVAVAKQGHHVTLIDAQIIPSRVYLRSERDLGIKHYTENGIELYEYKTGGFLTGRSAALTVRLYQRKVERVLKEILKTRKVDVLHAHSFYPAGIAAVALGKKYQIPVVLTEHCTGLILGWMGKDTYPYVKPTFDAADATVCVTNYFSQYLYEHYDLVQKPMVIGNVLNPLFRYADMPNNDVFTFVTVAFHAPKKRTAHIISAVAELKREKIPVKVHIVGEGPLYLELQQQAKDLAVEDCLEFHGNQPRERVYELLKRSNAMVHAAIAETFGVVYIEAMATGRPVVSAENGGSLELINEKNGVLAAPDDPHALAEAMKKMIAKYNSFDLKAISGVAISEFSEESIGKAYVDLYKKVLKK